MWSHDKKKAALFKTRSDIFACAGDLAGVRMTYTEHDRELVYKLVKEIFATAEVRPDLVREARLGWGVENNIYQFAHRGYAVSGGAGDAPYTYMT